jgi:hypothetical protein
MAIIISDTFTRSDSTTIGLSETGQAWTLVSGSVGVLSNQAYSSVSGGVVTINSGLATNYQVSYKQTVYHAWNWILWRYTNDNNTFRIEGTNIQKVVAGATTTLATIGSGVTSNDVLLVKVEGDTHTIYKNGVQVAQFTDAFNNTVTKQGFGLGTSASRVDNYLVESLTASRTTLVSDSFNRADTTASSTGWGSTDSVYGGTAKTWAAFGGATGQILSNQGKMFGTDAGVTVDSGQADNVAVSAVFVATNQAPQLIVRWAGSASYIYVAPEGGTYKLWKRNSGWTNIGSGGVPTNGDIVRIELSGTSIAVYQNATLLYTATDAFNQTSTVHGLGNGGGQPLFDDFKVESTVSGGGGTDATITATTATATSTALAPTVTAQRNVSVSATVATATAQAIAPSVSATSNATITAVTATATANAIAPTVSTTRNVTITAVTATASVTAYAPVAGSVTQVSAVTATITTQAIAPTVSTQKQVTIAAPTATSTVSAIAPSVSIIQPNVTINAVVATITARAFAPTVRALNGDVLLVSPIELNGVKQTAITLHGDVHKIKAVNISRDRSKTPSAAELRGDI